MRTVHLIVSSLAVLTLLSATAQAGTKDPRVNHRQHNQHARIAQGVKSGELTKAEAKDLRSDQKEIRTEEKEFKADGKLTKDERQELHQDQSASSKEIYAEKHDAQERPRAK